MIPAQHMIMPCPTAQQVRGPDSSSHSTETFFRAVSIPIKLEGGRVEESKHQGAARLEIQEGQGLYNQGHARKSARD